MRHLFADLRVVDTHEWIARDGSLWVFVVMTARVAGGRAYTHSFLMREPDGN